MEYTNTQSRTDLALYLLSELQRIYQKISISSTDIEKSSELFYSKMYNDSLEEIQGEIDNYKANIRSMNDLSLKVTTLTNEWYNFIKDPVQFKKLFFPLRLYFLKKKTQNEINKINQGLSELTIENRFILEKITNWEHSLELRTITKVKQGEKYSTYDENLSTMEELISELKYLLPTVHGLKCSCIDLDNIDILIEQLMNLKAA